MKTKKMRFRLESTCPLLMHNGALADPTNSIVKQIKKISGKRSKTDADHEQMSHLEFLGSLYLNEKKEPCIPAQIFAATVINGAKAQRLGKAFKAAMWIDGTFPLEYEGPREPEEMWNDGQFTHIAAVRIAQAKIMRTRAVFEQWGATIDIQYLDELEDDQIVAAVERAGMVIGLMDWRPTYGRFKVADYEILNGQ